MPKINIKKPIITISVVLVGLFLVGSDVLAYDNSITHPALTKEIIKYYNQYFNKNIGNSDSEIIINGSIQEDVPGVRTLNHFYDPISGQGLNSSNAGLLSSLYGFLMPFSKSAKEWASNSSAQANFVGQFYTNSALNPYARLVQSAIDSQTTYTWNKALYKYIIGDKNSAFESLGHVLHLLEDMAVPAHTRNDHHLSGDPYEKYVSENLSNNINIDGLKQPYILSNLDDYFVNLAKYSNTNFYSKNTMLSVGGYNSPNFSINDLVQKNSHYYICKILDGQENCVLYFKIYNGNFLTILESDIELADPAKIIFKNNWSHLSKQVISYGAGLVDLFFKEVDRLKNDQAFLLSQKETFWDKIVGAVSNFLGINDNNKPTSTPTPAMTPVITPTSTPILTPTPQIMGVFLESGLNFQQIPTTTPVPSLTSSPSATLIPTIIPTSTPISTSTPSVTPVVYGGYYATSAGGTTTTTSTPTPTPEESSTPTITPEPTLEPTPESTPTPSPTPTPTPQILISEFLYNASGSDGGKEFVELYNIGNESINLKDWSLRMKINDATSTDALAIFGRNEADKTIITAKGFLLIGLNSYDENNYNKAADIVRSATMGQQASTTYQIQLLDNSDNFIDSIIYIDDSVNEGQGLERKAFVGSTAESMMSGTDQYQGNSFDETDDLTDFIVRDIPQPQNSESLLEPRQQPPKIINLNGIRNDVGLILQFDLEEATTTNISFIVKSSATTTDITEINWSSLVMVSTTDIVFNSTDNKYELILLNIPTSTTDYFVIRAQDIDGWYSEISDAFQFPIIIEPTPTPSPTPIFFEGFEDYSLSDLHNQGGWIREEYLGYRFSVGTGTVYEGEKSIYFDFIDSGGYSIYNKSVDITGDGIFSFKLQAHSNQGPGGVWSNKAYLGFNTKDGEQNNYWRFGMVPSDFGADKGDACYQQVAFINSHGGYICVPGAWIDAWYNFQIEFSQTNGIRARVNENEWSLWQKGGDWGEYTGGLGKITITAYGGPDNDYYLDNFEFFQSQ